MGGHRLKFPPSPAVLKVSIDSRALCEPQLQLLCSVERCFSCMTHLWISMSSRSCDILTRPWYDFTRAGCSQILNWTSPNCRPFCHCTFCTMHQKSTKSSLDSVDPRDKPSQLVITHYLFQQSERCRSLTQTLAPSSWHTASMKLRILIDPSVLSFSSCLGCAGMWGTQQGHILQGNVGKINKPNSRQTDLENPLHVTQGTNSSCIVGQVAVGSWTIGFCIGLPHIMSTYKCICVYINYIYIYICTFFGAGPSMNVSVCIYGIFTLCLQAIV